MNWSPEQQQQLLSLISQRNERDRITRSLADAKALLTKKKQRLAALTAQLTHEQQDVDRLTGISWSNLYYTLLQQKEEQLAKEVAEVSQLKLDYVAADEETQQAEKLVTSLVAQLQPFTHVDDAYSTLLDQKRAVLHLRYDHIGRQYDQLVSDAEQADRRLLDAQEAFKSGRTVLDELFNTNMLLLKARQLGYMDLVGINMASYAKMLKLDDVRKQTYSLQQALSLFRREYADLGYELRRDIHIHGWDFIGDVFFDNFFSDRATQSRIDRALETIDATRQTIIPLVNELANQIGTLKSELATKSEALRSFLENT